MKNWRLPGPLPDFDPRDMGGESPVLSNQVVWRNLMKFSPWHETRGALMWSGLRQWDWILSFLRDGSIVSVDGGGSACTLLLSSACFFFLSQLWWWLSSDRAEERAKERASCTEWAVSLTRWGGLLRGSDPRLRSQRLLSVRALVPHSWELLSGLMAEAATGEKSLLLTWENQASFYFVGETPFLSLVIY